VPSFEWIHTGTTNNGTITDFGSSVRGKDVLNKVLNRKVALKTISDNTVLNYDDTVALIRKTGDQDLAQRGKNDVVGTSSPRFTMQYSGNTDFHLAPICAALTQH
jgi:hypothetical protein